MEGLRDIPAAAEQVRHQDQLDRARMTWWIPWLFVIGFVVSLAGLYTTIQSLRLGVALGVADAAFAAFTLLFGIAVVTWLRWRQIIEPRVVPYFARQLEPYGGNSSLAFQTGRDIYRSLSELDDLAAALGVKPLSAFGFADDFYEQPVEWHSASDGLATIDALRGELVSRSGDGSIELDLETLAAVLRIAATQDVGFSLVLRLYNHESIQAISTLQPRSGSFW
jgi:hypothetical protein